MFREYWFFVSHLIFLFLGRQHVIEERAWASSGCRMGVRRWVVNYTLFRFHLQYLETRNLGQVLNFLRFSFLTCKMKQYSSQRICVRVIQNASAQHSACPGVISSLSVLIRTRDSLLKVKYGRRDGYHFWDWVIKDSDFHHASTFPISLSPLLLSPTSPSLPSISLSFLLICWSDEIICHLVSSHLDAALRDRGSS